MNAKIIAVEKIVSSKDGKIWYKTFVKLTNSNGRSTLVEEWLSGNVGEKAFALSQNDDEPAVKIYLDYDENFRKSIIEITVCDPFDNDVIV